MVSEVRPERSAWTCVGGAEGCATRIRGACDRPQFVFEGFEFFGRPIFDFAGRDGPTAVRIDRGIQPSPGGRGIGRKFMGDRRLLRSGAVHIDHAVNAVGDIGVALGVDSEAGQVTEAERGAGERFVAFDPEFSGGCFGSCQLAEIFALRGEFVDDRASLFRNEDVSGGGIDRDRVEAGVGSERLRSRPG